MGNFVDDIEIDKIRNAAEIFPGFHGQACFLWTPELNRLGLLVWTKQSKKLVLVLTGFYRFIFIFNFTAIYSFFT